MNCPVCNVALVMSEKQGVEIDYCPKCRGVWLDKGELDKIIERSAAAESSQNLKQQEQKRNRQDNDDDDDDDEDGGLFNRNRRNDSDGNTGKRGGFLGNLFDF